MTTADALPVVLDLARPAAGRIRRHLEGELGWQPIEPDGPVPAVVRIVDVPASERVGAAATPTWLVVDEADAPAAAAAAAARLSAAAVVAWPPPEGAFAVVAARLADAAPVGAHPELRVGAAAGGVGCTTVALTLGALAAWAGERVLVVTHGAVPHPTGPTVEQESLRSPDVARAARPVRGVPGLDLLHVAGPAADVPVAIGDRTVVRDLGTADPAVDVLVARRDRAGLAAVHDTLAGTVLVSDTGVVAPRSLREAAGGRRLVLLPWSVRVARAGAAGRVPASLPGTWLQAVAAATGARPQGGGSRAGRRGPPGLR